MSCLPCGTAVSPLVRIVLLSFVFISVSANEGPSITQSASYFLVSEATPVNSVIGTINAKDSDGPKELHFSVADSLTGQIVYLNNTRGSSTVVRTVDVFLKEKLDYDRSRDSRERSLKFLIDDDFGSDSGNKIQYSVRLFVTDVNDEHPMFKETSYNGQISEAAAVGTAVLTVSATDLDPGKGGLITYSMEPTSESYRGFFKVDPASGIVLVNATLDYETQNYFSYTVHAEDNDGLEGINEATVVINVNDAQDRPPVFINQPYSQTIFENATLSSRVLQVTAVDGDAQPQVANQVTYSFIGDLSDHENFALDKGTGWITVKSPLDRDSEEVKRRGGVFSMKVKATEVDNLNQSPSLITAVTQVTIIVEDINDNAPTFNSDTYHATIRENMNANVPITFTGTPTVMDVKDNDLGEFSRFRLSLMKDGAAYEDFKVEPVEGLSESTVMIRVRRPSALDYEKNTEITFQVVAREASTVEQRSNTATVILSIEDENDNNPTFPRPSYSVRVPENATVGTNVIKLTATDKDTGQFGDITYSFKGNSNNFEIDQTSGQVSVRSPLDRERIDQYNLIVEASDGGGLTDFANLEITLDDVNDEDPQFKRQDYFGSVQENSMSFRAPLTVEASDDDQPDTGNSDVKYRILGTTAGMVNKFRINETTGEIQLRNSLNYEDLDPSLNGRISVRVEAYDQGTPRRQSHIDVEIQVEDVNDYAPEFNQSRYVVQIPENLAGGSHVIQVFAQDLDGTSPNNEFPYRIDSGAGDKFRINYNTGEITVETGAKLDRESKSQYTLHVSATDRGAKPMTGSCSVEITITDINDEPPVFNPESLSASISEGAAPWTEVKALTYSDPDLNSDMQFSLLKSLTKAYDQYGERLTDISPVEDYFMVDRTNGSVYVRGVLDRETAERLVLEVLAVDNNANPVANALKPQTATATLTVTLLDVNDHNPQFVPLSAYTLDVSEGQEEFSNIGTVTAKDEDKSRTITYTMGSDPTGNFTIDRNTGQLRLKNKLDRETKEKFQLTVIATDNGSPKRSSTATINVTVLDINDNNPVFNAYQTSYHVPENSPVNTSIAKISATDRDKGELGRLVYALDIQNDDYALKINGITGEIVVARPLNRELRSFYTVFVTATDNPSNPSDQRSKQTRAINIIVDDVNDNDPVFTTTDTGTPITVVENANIGTLVYTVSAEDADVGDNAKLEYFMSGAVGVVPEKFDIETDEQTIGGVPKYFGKIVVKGSLLSFVEDVTVTVTVKDSGAPRRSAIQTVEISVTDVNLHQPVFVHPTGPQAEITAMEEQPPGSFIFQIQARDDDHGKNGEVNYRIVPDRGDWEKFDLDMVCGNLTNRVRLDRETQARYELMIIATDKGYPKNLYSPLTLFVVLLDIDDKPPIFNRTAAMNPYKLYIEEERVGERSTHYLGRLAVDLDAGNNSVICYYITNGNPMVKTHFHLDQGGNLTLTKPLDRESQTIPEINMVILASSKCYEDIQINVTEGNVLPSDYYSNTSLLWVQVMITDINDNPPRFKQPVLTLGVTRDTGFGTAIFNLQDFVTDKDATKHVEFNSSAVEVCLKGQPCTIGNQFLVFKNGTVKTNTYFQPDMSGYFLIPVMAIEQVKDAAPFTDKALLRISLINDDQRVKVVFKNTPDTVRQFQVTFKEKLQNVTGYRIVVDKIQTHETRFGQPDVNMTDMFIHGEDLKTNETIPASELLRMIDYYAEALLALRYDYKIIEISPTVTPVEEKDLENVFRMALILVAVILALLCAGIIILFYISRQKYKRKLRAATAMAYAANNGTAGTGSQSDLQKLEMPGTNLHAYENVNPIYLEKVMLEEAGEITTDDVNLDDNAVDGPQTNGFSEQQKSMNFYQEDDNSNSIPQAKLGDGDAMLRLALAKHEAMKNGGIQNGKTNDPTVDSFKGLPTTEI